VRGRKVSKEEHGREEGKTHLEVRLESLQPPSTDSAVNNTVVARESRLHNSNLLEALLRRRVNDELLLARTDGKDARLRGVDDSGERLDAHHSKVRDGEGSSLVLLRLELTVTSLGSESLGLRRDGRETLATGVGDDGGDETGRGSDGDADVLSLVLTDEVSVPSRVGLGDVLEGEGGSLDDEVVDRELDRLGRLLGSGGGVEGGAELVDTVHVDLGGEVVVGDSGLRLGEALSDDTAHAGNGNVGVGSSGSSGGSLGGGGGGGGTSRGGSLELLNVLLEDATLRSGTLDLGEGNTLLESEALGDGGGEDDGAVGRELEGGGVLLSGSGGLLLLLGRLLLLLGLLLLLRLLLGGLSLGTLSEESVDGRFGEVVALLTKDSNGGSDLNSLRAVADLRERIASTGRLRSSIEESTHDNLAENTLVLSLNVHGSLVRLLLAEKERMLAAVSCDLEEKGKGGTTHDLKENVTGSERSTLLDLPRRDTALSHGRRPVRRKGRGKGRRTRSVCRRSKGRR
jgi:hypothetical protein